ncbi:jg24951, partial [Pararge aegeria aegeria]
NAYFVDYKELVRIGLISEMQKRGNEILIEVDGAVETYFFAAQRLKKTDSLEVSEPCSQVAYSITKKLEDMIRCRSMARKLTPAMKVKYKFVRRLCTFKGTYGLFRSSRAGYFKDSVCTAHPQCILVRSVSEE